MALGHWETNTEGGGIEVRRVSEPYTRRLPQPSTIQLGSKGPGGGVRKPDMAHHGVMQRGPIGPARNEGKRELPRSRDKSVERQTKEEIRKKEVERGKDRRRMGRSKGSSGIPRR